MWLMISFLIVTLVSVICCFCNCNRNDVKDDHNSFIQNEIPENSIIVDTNLNNDFQEQHHFNNQPYQLPNEKQYEQPYQNQYIQQNLDPNQQQYYDVSNLNQNISNNQNNINNTNLSIPTINYQGSKGQEYWRLQYTTNSINYKISELALKLNWRDQGWGNQKGLIDIRLCNYVQE